MYEVAMQLKDENQTINQRCQQLADVSMNLVTRLQESTFEQSRDKPILDELDSIMRDANKNQGTQVTAAS